MMVQLNLHVNAGYWICHVIMSDMTTASDGYDESGRGIGYSVELLLKASERGTYSRNMLNDRRNRIITSWFYTTIY